MLISGSELLGREVLSLHLGAAIAVVREIVIDPNDLKIVAFKVSGPETGGENGEILETRSIREFSELGMIVDSIDELVGRGEVLRLEDIMKINFKLDGKKVESRKGSKLGKVTDYMVDPATFNIMQLVVKRPTLKSLIDPELIIGRSEIHEVTDTKVIVKAEEDKLLEKSGAEDFVPNFVNPFRQKPSYAQARSRNPGEEDS